MSRKRERGAKISQFFNGKVKTLDLAIPEASTAYQKCGDGQ